MQTITAPASTTRVEARLEQRLRENIRTRLHSWAELALSSQGHTPAAHHLLVIDELERVARGEVDRLMLLLPPGSAKSTYASVLFPVWWFVRHPASSVIAAAHTIGLARHFGSSVRSLVGEHAVRLGYGLQRGASGEQFITSAGGRYFATGVRGAVTGRRADLLLVDDPIRSQAEANSMVARDRLWQWFRSDLLTRLRPGGKIVLIMTRWHPDDLGGRLLEDGDWRVLRLPAIAEPGDPLGRQEGMPLWPGWEGAEALQRKRQMLGEHAFAALFQQAPVREQGLLFSVARVSVIDGRPDLEGGHLVRAWDLAATSDGTRNPDWTVGLKLLRQSDGTITVLDVIRSRMSPIEVAKLIYATAETDGQEVAIALPQDPGQAGKAQVQFLTQRLAGFRVVATPETGSKYLRAVPIASQMDAGLVQVVRGSWTRAFLEEIGDFPNGSKDDQVDALSRAFMMLTTKSGPARFAQIPFLGR